MDEILEAERLGYDSVWTSEAYGSDAVSVASWILARTTRIRVGTAIMQMPARTPTCAAMTAMTLNALSGGRFLLGIGPSGPRVVEGWYGVPYGRPMTRTREYIDIVRQIAGRRAPLRHEGFHYQIPYKGADGTGLGRPMQSILHADEELRIYTAAVTPAGLGTAAEIADGVFPIWMDPERFDLIGPHLAAGFAKASRAGSRARWLTSMSHPSCPSRWAMISMPAGRRFARISRCISAAWGRGRKISIPTMCGAWATRPRRNRSRPVSCRPQG